MDPEKIVMYVALFIISESTTDPQLSTSSSTATAGSQFSFTCRIVATHILFEKDRTGYCTIINVSGNSCTSDGCPADLNYSCQSNSNEYTLTLPGKLVSNGLHDSKWRCGNFFGGTPTKEFELYVYVPISLVEISAIPVDNTSVEIATDTKQLFQCKTNAGRPSSRIQWYISDTNITDSAISQDDVCSPNCKGYVVSISILEYTGNRDDERKNIYCTALNMETPVVKSENRTVIIVYGPGNVDILPSRQFYRVRETVDSVGPIKCAADECKPNCRMKWNGPNVPDVNSAKLLLENISRNQAGNFNCTASNIAWSKTSVTVNVIVEYGPNKVTIDPLNQTYTVSHMIGSVGPITCTADCNPDCTMTWTGPNIPAETTSVLNLKHIDRNQAGSYQCTATNGFGSLQSVIVVVIVQYGPGKVSLSPPKQSYIVTESDTFGPINCTADCKPECAFTWRGPNLYASNASVLNLRVINRNQAGNYQCTASNRISGNESVIVTVIVYYGPKQVNISPKTETYIAIETTGSVDPITCTADCKPNCTLKWTGPNINSSATSILNLKNITKQQAGNYVCSASNDVGNLSSVTVTLVVHYGPHNVDISADEEPYTVNETGSVIPIACTSDCKPICTMIWKGPYLHVENTSVLTIRNITRKQAGSYKCIASNYVGNKTSLSVNIIVNFRPDVKGLLGNMTYIENDTVTVSCYVESVPTASIEWIFENKILYNDHLVLFSTSSNNSTLIIPKVGCLLMGTYNCTARNIIGQDTKAIDIDIACSPRINDIEYNVSSLVAVKDKEPLNITAPLIAYPKPNIYWTFVKNASVVNVTQQTSNTIIQNRVLSHLYIENVTEADFGFYLIYAFNGIGKTENYIHSFEVVPERKPNPPKNVTCIGRQNYVLVNWESNFNGGDAQMFQIFYKKDGDISFVNFGVNYSDPGQRRHSEATIDQLTADSTYHLKVRASNKHNYSMSEPASCNTTSKEGDDQQKADTIAVGAGTGIGAAVIILIIVALVFIFIRRRKNDNKRGQDKELIKRSVAKEEEDDEDGLKENPLYISSAHENVGAVYSTVDKKGQINKDKDKFTDDGTVYSQAVKNTKKGTNKTPASNPKKTPNKDLVNKEIEMGCIYANSEDITNGHDGDVYANSEIHSKDGDKHVYTPKKNKDGLIYADLDLAPTGTGHAFVIRGSENRNNYAVIDLTKTAEPLPSDSDNEDDQIDKNIDKGTPGNQYI